MLDGSCFVHCPATPIDLLVIITYKELRIILIFVHLILLWMYLIVFSCLWLEDNAFHICLLFIAFRKLDQGGVLMQCFQIGNIFSNILKYYHKI